MASELVPNVMDTTNALSDGMLWAKTIPFTNQSCCHEMDFACKHGAIFNYSEFYDTLSADEKDAYLAPNQLQTGDTVASTSADTPAQFVVWLHADLFHNPPTIHQSDAPVGFKRTHSALTAHSHGLSEDQLRKLRDLLALELDDDATFAMELSHPLKDAAPELLEKLLDADPLVGLAALNTVAFPPDRQLAFETKPDDEADEQEEGSLSDEDEDSDDGDEDDEEEHLVDHASSFFLRLPVPRYPRQLKRKDLDMSSLPFMQCYWFRHENGVAAPTAVSMAPVGYFPAHIERTIDLALLPVGPLRQGTTFGKALDKVLQTFPPTERKEYVVDFDLADRDTPTKTVIALLWEPPAQCSLSMQRICVAYCCSAVLKAC